jgi:16S rRNA (cytosine967-C5)-methyltransferase
MCGGEGFDRILLDVPCSTTGVLRRRPDARWRFSPERLNQLTRIQQAMLNNAATLLRPGGRLVYSTCSLEPEEGTELVRAWLRGRPEFRLLEERSLFPPDTQTDGVYAAALCCGG